jgi:6,7-dimethyl-8-ribityllumazine synthase
MTSSDLTLLPGDAKDRVASRVGSSLDGSTATTSGIRIAIVCAEFNGGITFRLLTGALDVLEELGGDLADVTIAWVPGAFELPLVAQRLADADTVDAVICLGAVIRGDTGHYEFVAGECASGLQRVQLDTGKPVVFGVLTTETVDQALTRSEGDRSNKGREAALTALHTAGVLTAVSEASAQSRVGFSVGRR